MKKVRARRRKSKEIPMSRGFGHLTIKRGWKIVGGSTVDGGNYTPQNKNKRHRRHDAA